MHKINSFRKLFWLLVALSASVIVFNSCNDEENNDDDKQGNGNNTENPDIVGTATTDPGVMINGVRWATRNVDDPGTFATTPSSAGKFYQWNRKTAWAATGAITGWNSSTPSGTEWEVANDPSPVGWRVPTYGELQSLCDTREVSTEWITIGGIPGRKFTDKTTGNSLFLPAAGYRGSSDGTLNNAGSLGNYWSSTVYDSYRAFYLYFYSGSEYTGTSSYDRADGHSVRCVAE